MIPMPARQENDTTAELEVRPAAAVEATHALAAGQWLATRREAYVRSASHAALARFDVELELGWRAKNLAAMLDAVNQVEAELLRLDAFAGRGAR